MDTAFTQLLVPLQLPVGLHVQVAATAPSAPALLEQQHDRQFQAAVQWQALETDTFGRTHRQRLYQKSRLAGTNNTSKAAELSTLCRRGSWETSLARTQEA